MPDPVAAAREREEAARQAEEREAWRWFMDALEERRRLAEVRAEYLARHSPR